MNKKLKLLAALITISAAGLLSQPAASLAADSAPPPPPPMAGAGPGMGQGMGPGMGPGMMGGPGMGRKGPGMEGRFGKALGLSADQKAKIKAIREAGWKTCEPLRKSLFETQKKIEAAIKATPFDENAVRSLAQSESDTRVNLEVTRAQTRSQIYAILTPEQQRKLDQLMAERRGPGMPHCRCRKNPPAGQGS